ncbi:hypothetical protein DUI87_21136 [Hirundo rustica rustica]|uniref:Uncharacterized protein n=1 Tax=Hirundo rustica rustica TaxID=333673 RepID=A0A3M0JS90_HIRRU|nr:hypothetical protein DUI87_21136 [Hirundo rustica rustica]
MKIGLFCSVLGVWEQLNLAYFVQGASAPFESSAIVEELGRMVLSEMQKQEWEMREDEQPQLSHHFFMAEVLQPSEHLCGLPGLTPMCPYPSNVGDPKTGLQMGPINSKIERENRFLNLLVMFLVVPPRTGLAFWAIVGGNKGDQTEGQGVGNSCDGENEQIKDCNWDVYSSNMVNKQIRSLNGKGQTKQRQITFTSNAVCPTVIRNCDWHRDKQLTISGEFIFNFLGKIKLAGESSETLKNPCQKSNSLLSGKTMGAALELQAVTCASSDVQMFVPSKSIFLRNIYGANKYRKRKDRSGNDKQDAPGSRRRLWKKLKMSE